MSNRINAHIHEAQRDLATAENALSEIKEAINKTYTVSIREMAEYARARAALAQAHALTAIAINLSTPTGKDD